MANTAEKNKALRMFHAVCAEKGLTKAEKMAVVNSYKCISAKEMTVAQLRDAAEKLKATHAKPNTEGDMWRKRVMAAIGGWLNRCKIESNAPMIKAIACRATGHKDFNKIPVSRLRNIYNEFRNKSTDAESVKLIKAEQVGTLENLN